MMNRDYADPLDGELDDGARLPIRRWISPIRRFIQIESASGAVLLVVTVVALFLANSRFSADYFAILDTRLSINVGKWSFDHSLLFWINDGLMTIFFFVVGLEIRREVVNGELREGKKAVFPVAGAIGGMIAPAVIYAAFIRNQPGHQGWGIPMATDIAFVVGVMAMFGRRMPGGLKVFMLALAIADDLGAVIVIALIYTEQLTVAWLLAGLSGIAFMMVLNRIGVRSVAAYVVVGICIWLAFLAAHVHPTVAGVLMGLITPSVPLLTPRQLQQLVGDNEFREATPGNEWGASRLSKISWAAREAVSPLERLEHGLHPAVGFIIMPLFAMANAGVVINREQFAHPVASAVAFGLIFGKPVGIVTACWLAMRLGLAKRPAGIGWTALIGAACLGGIGFTMSIFIAGLALPTELLSAGKLGTLAGSVVSAIIGSLILAVALFPRSKR